MSVLPPDDDPPARRGNGLTSAEWGALVDLDPRLSETLLDSLAAEGVAAYVEPAGDLDTVSRAASLPHRPLDRLWVDPARADRARVVVSSEVADLSALLAEDEPGATAHGLVRPVPRTAARRVLSPPELPGPPARRSAGEPAPAPLDEDALFQQIVAGFADLAPDVRPWPASEDLPPAAPAAPSRRTTGPGEPPRRRRGDAPAEAAGGALPGWVEPAPVEDDGHFEPPPPPPVPRIRLRTIGAVVMLVLGLLLLFAPGALRQQATTGVLLLGLALMAAGAGLLVWWMHDTPPTDDGSDDGAVV